MENNIFITRKSKILFQLIIIVFCFLAFIDSAIIAKGSDAVDLGIAIVILLLHIVFIWMLYAVRKDFARVLVRIREVNLKDLIPLIIVLIAFNVAAISQFDLIPRYDAGLYYADFVAGIRNFNFYPSSFINGFIIWTHPLHGIALFAAVGEFLAPGQMIGTYIMTLLISDVTIILFYRILMTLFVKISSIIAALGCAIFAFMPFMAGMFAYFNPDYYVILFFVWVIYCMVKDYPILTGFCGFLLLFSKESGALLYVTFVGIYVLSKLSADKDKPLWRSMKAAMPIQNVLLWIAPIAALLPFLSYGQEWALVKNGIPLSSTDGISSLMGYDEVYFNSRMYQFLIMSFRWITCVILLVVFIVYIIRRIKKTHVSTLSKVGDDVFAGIGISTLVYVCFISYFLSGLCPRYTGVADVFFAVGFVVSILYLFKSRIAQILAMIIFLVLNIAQTYTTIDPFMTNYLHGINAGHSMVYQVTVPEYDSDWYDCISDIYCYNLSYTIYDDLCNDVLKQIQPKATDVFFVEDVYYYELHIFGNQNNVYWNTRTNKRTYDGADIDSISIYYSTLSAKKLSFKTVLPDKFYVVDLARIEPELKDKLTQLGYSVENKYIANNSRGYITVYEMHKHK